MAKTVTEAFSQLIGRATPSEVETVAAKSHRQSINSCLTANKGMTGMVRAGSFGHGTSISGVSDVDYFAVVPAASLPSDSSAALRQFREVLERRFPNTGVYVDSPAVVLPFGSTASERHEITPAYLISSSESYAVYGIPDRSGGWMKSAPRGHDAYTNTQQTRFPGKAKNLIRLVKLWNFHRSAGIRSIYLELRTAEYLSGEASVLYDHDVRRALTFLKSKNLAAMQDPLALSGYLYPCTEAAKSGAISKIETAISRADKAILADKEGRVSDAFYWWNLLFDGYFPAYG